MAKAKENKTQAKVSNYKTLIAPIITEKTSSLGEGGSSVVFKVADCATKSCIKDAVEAVFGVKVATVRTANYLGKVKRVTGAIGRRAGYKKAFVTLQPGHTIDVVEGL